MSSSDGESVEDKTTSLDRSVFSKLILLHPVICEKSQIPTSVAAKKSAWKTIVEEYSSVVGKAVTEAQLKKLLSNIKTNIKKKTDTKETGNRKIKLKPWESELYDLFSTRENPTFCKVPGSINIGTPHAKVVEQDSAGIALEITNKPSPSTSAGKMRKINRESYETEQTKDLSVPQLQRIVLLQQMELQKMQIENEKRKLKTTRDVEVQTDITAAKGMSYFNL